MDSIFHFNKNIFKKAYMQFVINAILTSSIIISSYYGWISKYIFRLETDFFTNLFFFVIFFAVMFIFIPSTLKVFLSILSNDKILGFVNSVNKVVPLTNPLITGTFLYLLIAVEPSYYTSEFPSFTLYIFMISVIRAFLIFPCASYYNLYNSDVYKKFLNHTQKKDFHTSPTPQLPGVPGGGLTPEHVMHGAAVATVALGVLGALEKGADSHKQGVQKTAGDALAAVREAEQQTTRVLEKSQEHLTNVLKDEKLSAKCEQVTMAKLKVAKIFEVRDVIIMHEQKLSVMQNKINNMDIVDSIYDKWRRDGQSLSTASQMEYQRSMELKREAHLLEKPEIDPDMVASYFEQVCYFSKYIISLLGFN